MTQKLLAFLGVLFVSSIGKAEPWDSSFAEGRAASYLAAAPSRSPAVWVVGAGRERPADAVVAALKTAFAGTARLVLDGRQLGELRDLDDAALVKRASMLPVDAIAVVRVFSDASRHDIAVVTLYSKRGDALAAFSVEAGSPLSRYTKDTASQGVSNEAASAISNVLHNAAEGRAGDDTRSPARVAYDRQTIGFLEKTAPPPGTVPLDCPFEGEAHVPLCGPEFYDKVGRRDFGRAVEQRVRSRKGLVISGAVSMVLGTAFILGGALAHYHLGCVEGCSAYEPDWPILGTGLGFLGYGIVGVAVGSTLPPKTMERAEMYELARVRNEGLRRRLGLPDTVPDPVPAH